MTQYKVEVKETSSRIVTVETNCEDDAIVVVRAMYTNEVIVLDAEDYDDVEFEVVK